MDFIGYMKRKNYGTDDLAKMLGVSRDSVYAYKNGRCKPSYEVIEKLLLDGATLKEVFNEEIENIVISSAGVSPANQLSEAEIVRRGLLELAKQMKG